MSDKARKFMSKRNRACDSCRAKKAACRIDTAPPCYLCTLHRKECTFVQQTNRPRKPAKHPIESRQGHEILPASISEEATAPIENDPTSFNNLVPIDSSILPQLSHDSTGLEYFFQDDSPPSELFCDDPRPTGFTPNNFAYPSSPGMLLPQSNADKIPENGSSSNNINLDAGEMVPLLLGSSGDMDPLLLQHYQYDPTGNFRFKSLGIQSVGNGGNFTQFLLSPPSIFTFSREETGCDSWSPDSKRGELESIVPEEIGRRLINLFQRIVVPHYPIFNPSDPLEPGKSPSHLLASAYLLAGPFANFDERLCIELAYEKPPVKTLLKIINDVLAYEMYMPTISTVQTMLLYLIRPSANPIVQDSSFKWTQLSTLIGCAHSLGLHLDPMTWKISSSEICQRRRLSYCIYTIQKWLALTLGRPPILNSETWAVRTLSSDDRLDSGLHSEEWSSLMKRIQLESLLDPVLQLYSTKATDMISSDHKKTLDGTEPLIHSMTSWRKTVGVEASSLRSPLERDSCGKIGHILEMHYHYIHLTIIRAMLRPFLVTPMDEILPSEYFVLRSQVREQAKACTSAFVDFVHKLSSNDREIFWPTWSGTMFSSISFQILLMAITSLDVEESSFYWDSLQRLRRDMRLQADALPHLRLGLLRIDSIFWKGVHTVFRLDDHVRRAYFETTERLSGSGRVYATPA